jgi:hypothetical protein
MEKIPTGWLMLGSLGVVTIGFAAIGFSIAEMIILRNFLNIGLLIFTGLGTILSLVKGIGSLFPAIAINVAVFMGRRSLMELAISATITSIILFLGWGRTDEEGKENNKQILLYEWLGGICIAIFGYMVLQSVDRFLHPKLLPIGAGLLGGFLSIFTELSNFLGLKPQQITKLVTILAVIGGAIGSGIRIVYPVPPNLG